jgi:hypothetical protein
MYTDQQRVAVAVAFDADKVKHVTRCLALCPKALAASAVERHQPCLKGTFVGFFVHVAQHEHILGGCVLDDGWHKAIAFLEINGHFLFSFFNFQLVIF